MSPLTHLLDTSVYSQRLRPRPHPGVVRRWKQLGDHRLAISAICEAELLYGLRKRDSKRLWQEYHAGLESKLALCPVEHVVAQKFAELKARMEAIGQPRADFRSADRGHRTLQQPDSRHRQHRPLQGHPGAGSRKLV